MTVATVALGRRNRRYVRLWQKPLAYAEWRLREKRCKIIHHLATALYDPIVSEPEDLARSYRLAFLVRGTRLVHLGIQFTHREI